MKWENCHGRRFKMRELPDREGWYLRRCQPTDQSLLRGSHDVSGLHRQSDGLDGSSDIRVRKGVLVSGDMRVQRYGYDGRRQILSVLTRGDVAGTLGGNSHDCSIEAATDARICCADRRVFERLVDQDHGFRRAVCELQVAKLELLRWLTWTLGSLNGEEHLAAFLAKATTYMLYQPQPDGSGVLTVD